MILRPGSSRGIRSRPTRIFFFCIAAFPFMYSLAGTALPVPDPASGRWKRVDEVPLPGRATRFDYESLDSGTGRLYLAHLGDGRVVVFGTKNRKVQGDLPGFPHAHGVLAVPGLHRGYVTVSLLPQKGTLQSSTAEVSRSRLRFRWESIPMDWISIPGTGACSCPTNGEER